MTFDLDGLVRENIRRLIPYSSARSEFAEEAEVFLDANENSFGSPVGGGYNRYPDPLQSELKSRISQIEGVQPRQVFVGNGSDEAIDLLFRIFCRPGIDEAIICPPTYGMYRVAADINDIAIREVPLTTGFSLDSFGIQQAITDLTKVLFICSPNNPTGNLMDRNSMLDIVRSFGGIVVVDEAYIHYSDAPSMIREINSLPNLVVLQTFSKAWGMAGVRVGLGFASESIIGLMNRVKPPYNISEVAQQTVLDALDRRPDADEWILKTISERKRLTEHLLQLAVIVRVYPSDSNFILVKTPHPDAIYKHLIDDKIVVRNRNSVEFCEGCLRITVGTPVENDRMMKSLRAFKLEEAQLK